MILTADVKSRSRSALSLSFGRFTLRKLNVSVENSLSREHEKSSEMRPNTIPVWNDTLAEK